MENEIFDLIIVGAGPGGYVAAIRAAQLGMNVAVVEKRPTLGGVCLNEGCIPSKALLDSSELFALARDRFSLHGIGIDEPKLDLATMMNRKDQLVRKLTEGVALLLKKNGIQRIWGTARLAGDSKNGLHQVEVLLHGDGSDAETELLQESGPAGRLILKADKLLLATGSEALPLPGIPFDGQVVVSAVDALRFDAVPDHLVIAGGGFIGLEMGSVWRRLGAQVTIVEMLPHILPAMDRQLADSLYRSLRKQGIRFRLETCIGGVRKYGSQASVQLRSGTGIEEMDCDKFLIAIGRRPFTTGFALEQHGVAVDEKGRVIIGADYQTSRMGIYAVGDIVSGPMLAHKAQDEGVACVEGMAGNPSKVEYDRIPGVVYTWPEAAAVGATEEQLKCAGIPYAAGRFNFAATGRARCMDELDGFVKILAHRDSDKVLGVHIVGPRASDLIAGAVSVMSFGGTSRDIARASHAHPSLSEAIKEAALDVYKQAIHI